MMTKEKVYEYIAKFVVPLLLLIVGWIYAEFRLLHKDINKLQRNDFGIGMKLNMSLMNSGISSEEIERVDKIIETLTIEK